MCPLSLLLRTSTATLFLVLCLPVEIIKAQENTTSRKEIMFNLDVPTTASANKEVTVKLKLATELKECMVVKSYLISDVTIEGTFNYKQTRCLCEDSPMTLYWDFYVNRTSRITAVVDIVRELGICPDDAAVIPIKFNRVYATKTMYVR